VLDLYPHLDHVHVGSMIRVTDRDGYDNQPSFVDHDRLLFVSDREDGRTEVFLYTISTGALERVTDTPAEAEYSPRVAPGRPAISAVRVEADGTSQHLVRYPAAFLRRDRGGEPGRDAEAGAEGLPLEAAAVERLGAPLDDIGYYAWAGAGRVAVYRVGDPSSLHLVDLDGGGASRLVRERVGASVQSVPGTAEVSFVDVGDPERPVLLRLDGATGEVEEVAELPPGAVEHAWLSDITAYMGHEGTLYRSTSDPETPWYPILALSEAVGAFSRIAVTSGGRRIAVVVERDGAAGGSDPEAVGISGAALERITEAMEAHVEAGDVPGVVAAVVRDGKRVYHQAVGYRELESRDPMPLDALFRIYSMTRPVTAVGILLLEQDGLLDLNDPVERYLPEFAGQRVLEDPSDTGLERTRSRRGSVTLAHLLLHTSGIGSRSSALYRAHDVHGWDLPLEEVVNRVAALPLFEDPGTAFRYGMHSEVLGRVIEVVSGESLETFFQDRIFGPLHMTETMFFVDAERESRLAPVYRPGSDGRLAPHEMEAIPVTEPRALASAGVGLVTTVDDFLRFAQALLDGASGAGEGGGPLLEPLTLERIRGNAVPGELLPLVPRGYWAGSGWSLGGMAVVLDPSVYGHAVHPGEFWWDGSAGTRFWIDPEEGLVAVIMAQVSPAGGGGFRERFRTLVDEALVERRRRQAGGDGGP
jgi:CubicO group peptidase (beta-lactamase class C family)